MNGRNILIAATTSLIIIMACIALNTGNVQAKHPGAVQTRTPVYFTGWLPDEQPGETGDFTNAAAISVPAVVHVLTHKKQQEEISGMHGSGSGVIISEDGYIVTNNHVIDGADEITVILPDRKSYKAMLAGADINNDLAVLKIRTAGLPFLFFGKSDKIRAGEWVIAVGYPLGLGETVTAGIISVKSVSLPKNKAGFPMGSFIQTDAAINLGSSGGALVNPDGELIGIVTALASPTGAYAGYGYAIPVNTVQKTVNDIIKFGSIQKPTAVNLPNAKGVNDLDEIFLPWLFLHTGI